MIGLNLSLDRTITVARKAQFFRSRKEKVGKMKSVWEVPLDLAGVMFVLLQQRMLCGSLMRSVIL